MKDKPIYDGSHCGKIQNGIYLHCPYEGDGGRYESGGERILCMRYNHERCFDFGQNPDGTEQTCRVTACHDEHGERPIRDRKYCGCKKIDGQFVQCPFHTFRFRAISNAGGSMQDFCTRYNLFLEIEYDKVLDENVRIVRNKSCLAYEQ